MPDTLAFESFSIRAEPGVPPRAVLHPRRGAALEFDEATLRRRIAALRGDGADATVAESALAALRRVSALRDGLAMAPTPMVSAAPWRASVLAAAVEASREGLMLATAGAMARIVYANPAFGRMAGIAPEQLLGRDPAALLPAAAGPGPVALGLRRVDGTLHPVEAVRIALGPEGDAPGGHVAWLLRPSPGDAAAPGTDPLTGLATRDAVLAGLAAELAKPAAGMAAARGPCAAWLRAEHLAAAAMRHGGAARDALLLGLADRLTENLRRIDLLAHLGGGSFLLCLPRVSLLEARAIVARLRVATAAAPFDTPVGPVPLRLRTGIAAPEPDQDAAMLAEAARRAATARVAAQEEGRVAPG